MTKKQKESEKTKKPQSKEYDEEKSVEKPSGDRTAKKDFAIHQNQYDREIKAGDDLSDVPDEFLVNLKTEGVL